MDRTALLYVFGLLCAVHICLLSVYFKFNLFARAACAGMWVGQGRNWVEGIDGKQSAGVSLTKWSKTSFCAANVRRFFDRSFVLFATALDRRWSRRMNYARYMNNALWSSIIAYSSISFCILNSHEALLTDESRFGSMAEINFNSINESFCSYGELTWDLGEQLGHQPYHHPSRWLS